MSSREMLGLVADILGILGFFGGALLDPGVRRAVMETVARFIVIRYGAG